MNPSEFIAKWDQAELKERSAAQQHFLDLCDMLGHPKPAAVDQLGEWFTFERGVAKLGGSDGWADVWKKGFFGWEYKSRDKDLDEAYTQLKLYAEALENPPLLVVCDLHTIVIRTNFTNTPTEIHTIALRDLGEPHSLEILRALFYAPDKLKPGTTSQVVTELAARQIASIAERLREQGEAPEDVAVFLDRVVFCLFAEDVGLLPDQLFRRVVEGARGQPERLKKKLEELFAVMADGGDYGADSIRHFNGSLFTDRKALLLRHDEIEQLFQSTKLDWSAVDASIFGTLFERGLDPDKRSQLGAHYTSREDIETVIEPVVMAPLRREWEATKTAVDLLLTTGRKVPFDGPTTPPLGGQLTRARNEAQALIRTFRSLLGSVTVLDPACGSGNFLYVTLQKLKDLEKEVVVFTRDRRFTPDLPQVDPEQFFGIEVNRYAHDLAQMVVWIGYLQWIRVHGLGGYDTPVLKATDNIQCRDSILEFADGGASEPGWPAADFIIGNPPFLGGKRLRTELGDDYVDAMFQVYQGRVPAEADLCCYWFEKAREAIHNGQTKRAGLLATQSIRMGESRQVLDSIKRDGDIFFAYSDREWVLDGAAVRVSMVGFDAGSEQARALDGHSVELINADLTTGDDLTKAKRLRSNLGLSFQGDSKVGPFEIPFETAQAWLDSPNVNGRPNSDVIRPWLNAMDITRRPRGLWIIDYPPGMSESDSALYEEPFKYILEKVRPFRRTAKSGDATGVPWWIHQRPRVEMRQATSGSTRYLVTPRVAKHRVFAWMDSAYLPDTRLNVFSNPSDELLGLLQSRIHEIWSLAKGSWHGKGNDPTYNNRTCFETFPFPKLDDSRAAIATAANELNALRLKWLNPPEWTAGETLVFPASTNGPWRALLKDPDERGIGMAHHSRIVARDEDTQKLLKKRTLTNLYNERPQWLVDAHRALDSVVFAAYGWNPDLSDTEILARLLKLNLAGEGEEGAADDEPDLLDGDDED